MVSLKAINAALRLFKLKLVVIYDKSRVTYMPVYFMIERTEEGGGG